MKLLIKSLAAASLMAQAAVAFAQSAPSDKVALSVTRAELQVIGQGLMELPYKTSAPIMGDLQAQLNAADQAAVKAATDAKAKAEADAKSEKPKK